MAEAYTVYESDNEYHEEGYIFIGESHIGNCSTSVWSATNKSGNNQRYPQGMWDPTLKSDTSHWNHETNIELITSVIHKIQEKHLSVQHVVTEAILYTNDATVVYSDPSLESIMILPDCDAGLPIRVTGVTDNGYFRVDLGAAVGYVVGSGLSERPDKE